MKIFSLQNFVAAVVVVVLISSWRNVCNFRTWHVDCIHTYIYTAATVCVYTWVCVCVFLATVSATFSFTISTTATVAVTSQRTVQVAGPTVPHTHTHAHNNKILHQLVFCKRRQKTTTETSVGKVPITDSVAVQAHRRRSRQHEMKRNKFFCCCCAYVTRQRRMQQ